MSADQQTPGPLLLKIDVAADLLGISQATFYRLIAAGEIATVKFGRAHRVPVVELDRLVQRRLGASG